MTKLRTLCQTVCMVGIVVVCSSACGSANVVTSLNSKSPTSDVSSTTAATSDSTSTAMSGPTTPMTSANTALPAIAADTFTALNNTDVTVTPASPGDPSPPVSMSAAESAALAAGEQGTTLLNGSLVTLENDQYPNGELVWAIQVNPSSSYAASIGPVLPPGDHTRPSLPPQNTRIDFVDATSGVWLEGVTFYTP